MEELRLSDNKLVGIHTIPDNGEIQVTLDIDKENPSTGDFSEMIDFANTFLSKLTRASLDTIGQEIAGELTSAAYSQSSYEPTVDDQVHLAKQLKLQKISFFPEEVISMVFEAKEDYPDMLIYCQVDQDFVIEDFFVE